MKLKTILFLTLALLCACSGKKVEYAGNALSLELTSVDYEIISKALEHFFRQPLDSFGNADSTINKRDYYKLLITGDSTINDPNPSYGNVDPKYDITDSTGNPIGSQIKYKINSSKISSFNVRSLTKQEFTSAFRQGFGYSEFYKQYPEAYCIIHFSRPSYSNNRERARVFIDFEKQVLWGKGAYVLFKFENGKWVYIRTDEVWVS